MMPFPTVWSQLATCATTGRPRRRAATRNGTAECGCTLLRTSAEQSRRIAASNRLGTWRSRLKCQRSSARSSVLQRGNGPARAESSIQFGCPGCIRSRWNPCR